MAVYTKRGDKGDTSLYDEDASQRVRISKDSLRINALGKIDELNSYIGVTVSSSDDRKLSKKLNDIQSSLLTVGAIIAGSNLRFSESKTKKLEQLIDEMEGTLPPLANFVLPGGSPTAANLQFCRSLTRGAERALVALNKEEAIKPQILIYINRLSDFFFMLARWFNFNAGIKDVIWTITKKS